MNLKPFTSETAYSAPIPRGPSDCVPFTPGMYRGPAAGSERTCTRTLSPSGERISKDFQKAWGVPFGPIAFTACPVSVQPAGSKARSGRQVVAAGCENAVFGKKSRQITKAKARQLIKKGEPCDERAIDSTILSGGTVRKSLTP